MDRLRHIAIVLCAYVAAMLLPLALFAIGVLVAAPAAVNAMYLPAGTPPSTGDNLAILVGNSLCVIAIVMAIYFTISFTYCLFRPEQHDPAARPCVNCGYDLRGTATSTSSRRCPECGTIQLN